MSKERKKRCKNCNSLYLASTRVYKEDGYCDKCSEKKFHQKIAKAMSEETYW